MKVYEIVHVTAVLLLASGCGSGTGPAFTPSLFSKAGGDLQRGPSSAVLPLPLTVLLKDDAAHAVPGVTVTWSITGGGGSLASATSVTNAAGMATVSLTLGPGWGVNTVSASAASIVQPLVFTATAGVESGGSNVPERYESDLWVANGYAYTGTWGNRAASGNALKIWQLGVSGAPALIDSIVTPGFNTLSDVQVSEDNQYLVFTGEYGPSAGLYVYSLANPAHPTFLGKSLVPDNGGGLHTGTLSVIGGKLYAFTARDPGASNSPAWLIYDLSTPSSPTLADSVPIPANYGIHDTYVRNGIAFVCAWNSGVMIYDVGDGRLGGSPSSPKLISTLVTAGGEVHNAWWFNNPVTGQAKYLFIGQEGPGTIGSSSRGDIHVVDVSNLATPTEVASYHMSNTEGTHNFWMDESAQTLYAAYYNGGVVALDVSGTLTGDLASRERARIQPGGSGNTYIWGVQLYGNSIYATDMISGFWQLSVPH
ncbi:MAG: Ig-like domain-containing protein [Gemmatimonadota bacterium]